MILNFSTYRARAEVDLGEGRFFTLLADVPFNTARRAGDLGVVGFGWYVNASGVFGNNYLLVDRLSVEARPNPRLSIEHGARQRTSATSYVLRGSQSREDDVKIQWRPGEKRRWRPVRGQPTKWKVQLTRLQPGRNEIHFRLLDARGRELEQKTVTVLVQR